MMTGRERVLTALAHREPDRVPITFDAEAEVKVLLKNHFHVTTDDELWRALHVDTRLVGATHHHPNQGDQPDGTHRSFWGYGSKQIRDAHGVRSDIVYFPLGKMTTAAELDQHPWPAADELTFEKIRESRQNNPDAAIIAHITHGGYFNGTFLRGMEQFCLDLAGEPAFARKVIGKITDYLFPAVERLCKEAGDSFDIFYMADDFCTARGPLVSPACFRKFIKPYLATIAGIVHGHDKKFLLHVCGSVRTFLPELIDAGVDLLEPIQTSAEGMAVEGLKRDFGAKMAFYGSIDLIQVLARGTPAQVRAEVLKNFRVLGPQGGFILGPGHTYIQPDTPLENILSMYKTGYEECRYTKNI
ncbi:MAG TPA: uroporphyrinogen decarboxylase family protein [Planctomycetota bacterium]|nr:uroporphyrinogen decarboxylase family protein [Planctomycetota bacterium]